MTKTITIERRVAIMIAVAFITSLWWVHNHSYMDAVNDIREANYRVSGVGI